MKTACPKHVRQWALPAALLVFLVCSVLLMRPLPSAETPLMHGRSLKKVETREGNTERIDYVDDQGAITFAADMGYATMITTIIGSDRLERFYDEHGEPVKRYSKYYAILRSYDEAGRNAHITYLGLDGEPDTTAYGYSDVCRTYNDKGKIETEKYYDGSGNRACSYSNGYGLRNEYNDRGQKIRTTYLDAEDRPMVIGLGYASATYRYHEDGGPDGGKAAYEFYFDAEGEPAALSLGQYGVYKAQYDAYGQNALTTYVDADGQPLATSRGYASVLRTYYADYRIETERYFDSQGNPFRMPDGQYGVRYENEQTIYLDQNGKEQFHLKRLLYNASSFVILFASGVLLLSCFANKKLNLFLLLVYCIAIGYFTLLHRENIGAQGSGEAFQQFRAFFSSKQVRLNILNNIWLFIPLGAILFHLYPKKIVLLIPAALSVLIEGMQLLTGTGYCEADDVICNSLGGCIGYGAGQLLSSAACCFKGKRAQNTREGSCR